MTLETARGFWPATYEDLVDQLLIEHPGTTREEIDAAIREVLSRRAERRRRP
jgi:hypothetical protein